MRGMTRLLMIVPYALCVAWMLLGQAIVWLGEEVTASGHQGCLMLEAAFAAWFEEEF